MNLEVWTCLQLLRQTGVYRNTHLSPTGLLTVTECVKSFCILYVVCHFGTCAYSVLGTFDAYPSMLPPLTGVQSRPSVYCP